MMFFTWYSSAVSITKLSPFLSVFFQSASFLSEGSFKSPLSFSYIPKLVKVRLIANLIIDNLLSEQTANRNLKKTYISLDKPDVLVEGTKRNKCGGFSLLSDVDRMID